MSFVSPKTLLSRLGLKPKKKLGQHFLLHPHQARRIVAALGLTGEETVVEIGAGLGALTGFLAQAARRVIALERDPELARFLREDLFMETPGVEIICQDVLEFDFQEACLQSGRPLAVVGNLPYQITSPLLFTLMRESAAVTQAVLMMQQEVGDRLLASPGTKDYGILSVLSQYYFRVIQLFQLSPGNFYPPPQVDSVVLRLLPESTTPAALDEALLQRLVKTAFGHRRKTLNNTVVARAEAFGLTPAAMHAVLAALDIDPKRRGETLSLREFVEISNKASLLKSGAVKLVAGKNNFLT
ncbi:MAG TPA: 16S rRNA (adenine(1518)-N(6)/adenine(1519)-N(6))-dimethyltransferase RsmA [Desulfobaccales bacterium]|nr:16S rRNA (adenine(1518)-N(6)/adenine(1519)-N(6))-dimethyltransferase RsmA [Desulfobaccales bacterium]